MLGVTQLTGFSANTLVTTRQAARRAVGSPPNHEVPQVSVGSIAHDTVRFSSTAPVSPSTDDSTVDQRLNVYARKVLSTINDGLPLCPGQPLQLTGDSTLLPLMRKLVEVAYRDHKSGEVHVTKNEPELEALKKQFGATQTFAAHDGLTRYLDDHQAVKLKLGDSDETYRLAGLKPDEITALKTRVASPLSPTDAALQAINPDEILFECLDLRPGQPLQISAQREQMPQVLALAKRAMENGTKLLRVVVTERPEFDLNIPYYQFASDAVIDATPITAEAFAKETIDKNVARVTLYGADPEQYAGLDSARIQRNNKAYAKAIAAHNMGIMNDVPWSVYYLPTTASAKAAGYASLTEALTDARKINRVGQLKPHFATLRQRQDQMNALADQGYRTVRYVSMGPDGRPDGKTDLTVKLAPKSFFKAATLTTTRGQQYFPNVPSEEIFTSPDATTVNGVVTATLPLSLNGQLITDLRVEFKDGRVAKDDAGRHKISATKNEQVFRELIAQNEDAFGDRLGEIAFVAGSPIFDTGRVFQSTLLDENAASHIAVGRSFPFCVTGALDIKDTAERTRFLDEQKVNPSTCPIHVDFMIGAPNVHVILTNDDATKPPLTIIKDNAFQLGA